VHPHTVGRAFNSALAESGGSIPIWLILSTLKSQPCRSQLELARAVGIEGPTLTRHLDGMEQAGLVKRQRGTLDRRAVQVELTRAGHALHGPPLESRDQLQPTATDRSQRRG
jgi:MarR family transcriptional regulator, transcriptional regulator for hemolysin